MTAFLIPNFRYKHSVSLEVIPDMNIVAQITAEVVIDAEPFTYKQKKYLKITYSVFDRSVQLHDRENPWLNGIDSAPLSRQDKMLVCIQFPQFEDM